MTHGQVPAHSPGVGYRCFELSICKSLLRGRGMSKWFDLITVTVKKVMKHPGEILAV